MIALGQDRAYNFTAAWDAQMNTETETARRITSAAAADNAVRVTWDDGRVIAFDTLWLRDNCGCETCRHPMTHERTFDTSTLPESLGAATAAVSESGALRVVWDFDGHVSTYEARWLARYARPPEAGDAAPAAGTKPGGELPSVDHVALGAGGGNLLPWLRMLRDSGIALLRGVPAEPRAVLNVARRISYPRPTNFGEFFDVESVPRPNSNAYTAMRVNPHTDLPNWAEPPGFQFLHCLENGVAGGESLFVDGFEVARALRRADAAAFELLTQTPLDFRFHDAESDIRTRAPAIATDGEGRLRTFRFNVSILDTLRLPPESMAPVYRAYRKLAVLVRDPAFETRVRLAAGDLVAFDNHRMLHGREAFDPSAGRRHLQGCYVDRDELLSRIRVLERRRSAD